MKMRTKEEILYDELSDRHIETLEHYPHFKEWTLQAMEAYAEQQSDLVHDLFNKPAQVLDPLEDLWRKENSPNQYVIPDRTKFYEWIVKKLLNT